MRIDRDEATPDDSGPPRRARVNERFPISPVADPSSAQCAPEESLYPDFDPTDRVEVIIIDSIPPLEVRTAQSPVPTRPPVVKTPFRRCARAARLLIESNDQRAMSRVGLTLLSEDDILDDASEIVETLVPEEKVRAESISFVDRAYNLCY